MYLTYASGEAIYVSPWKAVPSSIFRFATQHEVDRQAQATPTDKFLSLNRSAVPRTSTANCGEFQHQNN